ncbi:MAG TPA: PsiF family protein [Steroidobacteraceae bacterium]|nr:PsiF family protein [Steroidobacteraceae bacterium]
MKNLMALTMTLLLASMSVNAENAQQTKMKDCNAQAKTQDLNGDARKSFMKTCLTGAAAGDSAKLNSQQQKMKDCNAEAKTKGLKGADRKSFMSTCLKG